MTQKDDLKQKCTSCGKRDFITDNETKLIIMIFLMLEDHNI